MHTVDLRIQISLFSGKCAKYPQTVCEAIFKWVWGCLQKILIIISQEIKFSGLTEVKVASYYTVASLSQLAAIIHS